MFLKRYTLFTFPYAATGRRRTAKMAQESNQRMYAEKQAHWGEREYAGRELNAGETYLFKKYLAGKKGRLLEGGTGSGSLAFHAETLGTFEIDAFDFIPQFIENANQHKQERNSKVRFFIADAASLEMFQDNTYDYGIYLQQVLSFVPTDKIDRAFEECYKKMKKGGIVLVSLLNYEGRRVNRLLSSILGPVRALRGETGLSRQELPWLHVNKHANWRALQKGQATMYWFHKDEAVRRFENIGFRLVECKTAKEIAGAAKGPDGMLFLVLEK